MHTGPTQPSQKTRWLSAFQSPGPLWSADAPVAAAPQAPPVSAVNGDGCQAAADGQACAPGAPHVVICDMVYLVVTGPSVNASPATSPSNGVGAFPVQIGDVVEVFWDGERQWFQASVIQRLSDGNWRLHYQDGELSDEAFCASTWRRPVSTTTTTTSDPLAPRSFANDDHEVRGQPPNDSSVVCLCDRPLHIYPCQCKQRAGLCMCVNSQHGPTCSLQLVCDEQAGHCMSVYSQQGPTCSLQLMCNEQVVHCMSLYSQQGPTCSLQTTCHEQVVH